MKVIIILLLSISLALSVDDNNSSDYVDLYKVGELYENGDGVKQDIFTAYEFYLKSAKNNDPEGMYKIGMFYYRGGNPVKKNLTLAKKWFKGSCDQGHKNACLNYNILNFHER